jgi:hypothetical protein
VGVGGSIKDSDRGISFNPGWEVFKSRGRGIGREAGDQGPSIDRLGIFE